MSQNLSKKRKNNKEGCDKHDITERAGIYWLNKAQIKPAQISKLMDIPDSTVRDIIADQKENDCIDSNKKREVATPNTPYQKVDTLKEACGYGAVFTKAEWVLFTCSKVD
jgi:hypothetical protein